MQHSLCLGQYSFFEDGEKMTDVRTLLADLTLLKWELLTQGLGCLLDMRIIQARFRW